VPTRISTRASSGSSGSISEGSVLIRRLVYIAFFLEVGLLLIVLPWSSFWERNYFADAWPAIRPFLTNNFVRGAVSGLGVVNLFAGAADLAQLFSAREPHEMSGHP
jgi:hypothetical protein